MAAQYSLGFNIANLIFYCPSIRRFEENVISSAARKINGKNLNFVCRLCDGLH